MQRVAPICLRLTFFVALAASVGDVAAADSDVHAGRLLMIGGGMRRTSNDIYDRLIDGAGGIERARIGVLPTASRSLEPARKVVEALVRHGLPADRVEILDLTPFNAAQQAANPQLAEQVRRCTGVFISGGDQRRVTAALFAADGSERPVLAALRDVYRSGGSIAGSSAGAAVQSELMLAVSGLPPDSVDEGFDALDYGLSSHDAHRGLRVTRGLGFFHGGIIDQHFNQFRGRLGRLARVAVERKIPFAFGIDENTAIDVAADGSFEVVGAGAVTVIDAQAARLADGPLGCRLTNVVVSHLEQGDRFAPQSGQFTIHSAKQPIQPGREEFNGNHLIADIAGEGAVARALISGLAENTRRTQFGVMLQHARHFAHGYRFTFSKTERTASFGGNVRGEYSNAIINVRLDVEPIVGDLRPAGDGVPGDLPADESRTGLEAIWFRGLLLAGEGNRLHPDRPITQQELAGALARTIHLEPPREPLRLALGNDATPADAEELEKVVGAGLMVIGAQDHFRSDQPLSRGEAAAILVRACERYRSERLPTDAVQFDDLPAIPAEQQAAVCAAIRARLLPLSDGRFHPEAPLTRRETALALYRMIGFPWAE